MYVNSWCAHIKYIEGFILSMTYLHDCWGIGLTIVWCACYIWNKSIVFIILTAVDEQNAQTLQQQADQLLTTSPGTLSPELTSPDLPDPNIVVTDITIATPDPANDGDDLDLTSGPDNDCVKDTLAIPAFSDGESSGATTPGSISPIRGHSPVPTRTGKTMMHLWLCGRLWYLQCIDM